MPPTIIVSQRPQTDNAALRHPYTDGCLQSTHVIKHKTERALKVGAAVS